MASSVEDLEFLVRSEHRVDALRILVRETCDRDDLQKATGASKATIARLLNDLEDRRWVVRDGHQYELTDLGQFVATELLALLERMETERAVRDVWQWFPTELPEFTIGLFADAHVSFPDPDAPYDPSPRFIELIEPAQTVCAFSARNLKPGTYEEILREAASGTETELVFAPAVIANMQDVLPDEITRDAAGCETLNIFEKDRFPMEAGFGLFGNRVGVFGRDSEGVARAGLDTDTPEAFVWGERMYEEVRREASKVDLFKWVS